MLLVHGVSEVVDLAVQEGWSPARMRRVRVVDVSGTLGVMHWCAQMKSGGGGRRVCVCVHEGVWKEEGGRGRCRVIGALEQLCEALQWKCTVWSGQEFIDPATAFLRNPPF